MPRETVKSFVERGAKDGVSAVELWRAVQRKFPNRICSWGYILRLVKSVRNAGQAVREP